jgi:hypothetical protein
MLIQNELLKESQMLRSNICWYVKELYTHLEKDIAFLSCNRRRIGAILIAKDAYPDDLPSILIAQLEEESVYIERLLLQVTFIKGDLEKLVQAYEKG